MNKSDLTSMNQRSRHKKVFKGAYRLMDKIGTKGLIYWGKVKRKGTQAMTCEMACPICGELFRDYMWKAADDKITMCKNCKSKQ